MNYPYILFLITFLVFPIIGFVSAKYISFLQYKKLLIRIFLFFGMHNLLFFLGYSLKGDYVDYTIFSLEYLFCCIIMALFFNSDKIMIKVIGILGVLAIVFGYLIGIVGTLLFIVASQDYVADKIYDFKGEDDVDYQSRRYYFGFATLDNTKYTFDTYKIYSLPLFEKHVDTSAFFDTKTALDLYDDKFNVKIIGSDKQKKIVFASSKTSVSKNID